MNNFFRPKKNKIKKKKKKERGGGFSPVAKMQIETCYPAARGDCLHGLQTLIQLVFERGNYSLLRVLLVVVRRRWRMWFSYPGYGFGDRGLHPKGSMRRHGTVFFP